MSRGGNGDAFAWSERLRGGKPGDLNGWETRLEMLPALAQRIASVEFRCGCGITMMEEQCGAAGAGTEDAANGAAG